MVNVAERRFKVNAFVVAAMLGAVAAVRWFPYLSGSPGFLMDDWLFVDRAQRRGVWEAAGGGLTTRPGSRVVYAATFGLSQSPRVLVAVLAVVNVAVAFVLWRAAERWLPASVAAAVGVTWLLVPTHSAVDYWPSAIPIAVSLLVFLGGVVALSVAYRNDRSTTLAGVAFVTSVAVYEITLGLAVLALLAVPVLERKAIRWGPTVLTGVAMAAPAGWIGSRAVYRDALWLDAGGLVELNLTLSSTIPTVKWVVGGAVVTVLAVAWWMERSGQPWLPGRLALAGLVVMIVGAAPAARFPWSVTGFGDRVNVAAAIGAAMITGAAIWSLRFVRGVAWMAASALALVAISTSWNRVEYYSQAVDDGRAWMNQPVERPLPPSRGPGIYAFCCEGDRSTWGPDSVALIARAVP